MAEAVIQRGQETFAPKAPTDVWSRWGAQYRVRAILLLCVSVVLFACVCCFAYWLRTGVFFAPFQEGYWNVLLLTFSFTGQTHVTLASFLVGPMKVSDVPALIPIVGLLVAGIVTIPVLVAILYRLVSCLPFIAVVAFLAVMPWLAITLLGCCVLATCRPFRQRSPFMSAMIALLPVVLYFVLASRGTASQVGEFLDPLDPIKFVAPWATAIVAGALLIALVLGIARVVNYRPGAIAPMQALMFCLPAILFELHVGRDELHYRLIEQGSQGSRGFFVDRQLDWSGLDASADLYRIAERDWFAMPEPRPRFSEVLERVKLQWSLLQTSSGSHDVEGFLTIEGSVLTEHQVAFARQCDEFLKYYPDSRYAANVLYLKATAWCMRVELSQFRRQNWIRFYDDFPHPGSWFDWRRLVENFPDSRPSAVARLRLAQLEGRKGEVDLARHYLDDVIARFDHVRLNEEARSATTASWRDFLRRRDPEDGLVLRLKRALIEAHRLRDLIAANNDPAVGHAPLCGTDRPGAALRFGLLHLDPHSDAYAANVQRLRDAYAGTLWEDNLELELARSAPDVEDRVARLTAFLNRYGGRDSDAEPEARFLLGVLLQEVHRSTEAVEQLERLVLLFPQSIWAAEAKPLMAAPVPITPEPATP